MNHTQHKRQHKRQHQRQHKRQAPRTSLWPRLNGKSNSCLHLGAAALTALTTAMKSAEMSPPSFVPS